MYLLAAGKMTYADCGAIRHLLMASVIRRCTHQITCVLKTSTEMKTMTTFQVTSNRNIQNHIILITLLLTAVSNSQGILHITNLDCFNDYDSKMFCSWNINSNRNCSEEFQLKYTDFMDKTLYCHDLGNEHSEGIILPDRCRCNITVRAFVSTAKYKIEVESQGTPVGNTTIDVYHKVKPKAPSNVRVEFNEDDNGIVHWDTNYANQFIADKFSFQVQFICKQDKTMSINDTITQVESWYKFSKRQLKRGYDYMVRVRTKPAENQNLRGISSEWSEWNPNAEWRNDYRLTIAELKSYIIPFSCIVTVFIILTSYFCVSRFKNKWWDNIPDPAKSNLAQILLIPKNQFNPDGKSSASKIFGNCLGKNIKNEKNSENGQLEWKQVFSEISPLVKKTVFEPEDENIESCVEIYPKINENSQSQADTLEDKDEDHLLGNDFSIDRMFCDILGDSSAQKMETLDNFNIGNTFGSFGCPSFMEPYNKDETRSPEACSESIYHNYDSDDCPRDFTEKLYGPNTTSFGNKNDFLPYAPPFNLDQSCSQDYNDNNIMNSGYNSFSNALAQDKLDSVINMAERDPILNFCMDSSSQSMPYNPNTCNILVTPNSIFYYNSKHSLVPSSNEADLQIFNLPKDELVSQCKVPNHGEHTDPCSMSEVSGYQSFNQAVEQSKTSGNTSCPVFASGYKPFESLLTTNIMYLDNMAELNSQCNLDDSLQSNEEPLQKGMLTSITDHGGKTTYCDRTSEHEVLAPGVHSEFCLVDFENIASGEHNPLYSETFYEDHRDVINATENIQSDSKIKLQDDIPLALTFDICDHLRNFTNMYVHKLSLNSLEPGRFPLIHASFPCRMDEATFIHDHLSLKKCHPAQDGLSVMFQNISYFLPLYNLKDPGCSKIITSHLLLQQNNLDKDGNSYMRIAL